jgi:hypothetical protein
LVVAVDTLAAGGLFHSAFLVRSADGGRMPWPTAREAVAPSDRLASSRR